MGCHVPLCPPSTERLWSAHRGASVERTRPHERRGGADAKPMTPQNTAQTTARSNGSGTAKAALLAGEALLTKRDVAAMARVSGRCVNEQMRRGWLPFVKISAQLVRFRRADVERWIEEAAERERARKPECRMPKPERNPKPEIRTHQLSTIHQRPITNHQT